MDTIGKRLRWWIKERWRPDGKPGSLRKFQAKIEDVAAFRPKLKGKGVSYPSINSYLSDKVDPPLEFLRVAAELLGVREAWLISGDGPPTVEELEALRSRTRQPTLLQRKLEEAFTEGWPHYPALDDFAKTALWDAWRWYRREIAAVRHAKGIGERRGHGVEWVAAKRVARAVGSLLADLKIRPEEVSPDSLSSFVGLASQAIKLLVAEKPVLPPEPGD